MDDLLDLNWTETKITSNIQSKTQGEPKDAFADLLPTSPKQQVDISKLSLAEQQQRMRNQPTSSSSSSPWLTPLQASTPIQSSSSTPQQTLTPLQTLTPSINLRSSSTTPDYSSPSIQQAQAKSQPTPSFEDLLNPFGSKKSTSNKNTPLKQLRNQSNTSFSSSGNDGQWNFDLLDTSQASSAPIANKVPTITPSSALDPFDMDNLKETSGVNYTSVDEDNPLGILAGPAPETPVSQEEDMYTKQQVSVKEEPAESNSYINDDNIDHSDNNNNMDSHIGFIDEDEEDRLIAQLIDMGFSLQESKIALEATGNYNLQAAIDLLVQNSEAAQRNQPERTSTAPHLSQNERARMALFDNNTQPTSPIAQRERQMNSSQITQQQRVDDPIQQQTEKIVAQAQEFGGFLYKNATSFLKTGREKVTKAVGDWQEHQRAQRLHQPADGSRPKWMTENIDLDGSNNNVQPVQGFVDDADSDEEGNDRATTRDLELERRKIQEMRRRQEAKQREQAAAAHKMRMKAKQESLIGDDDVYVSPSRRRGGNSGRSTPQSRSQTPVKNTPAPPQKIQRTRPIINAPANMMQKVNEARNEGNEKFKLGQFGDAEIAYTRALDLLPEGHDHQVLLCNNRAACRLKNGDYKKCIQDCDTALDMAKQSGEENSVSEGVTIQWRDQIIKSLSRKGEAFENIEKYKEALDTYHELMKYNGNQQQAKVNQAIARCRQALNPKPTTKKEAISSPISTNTNTSSTTTTAASAQKKDDVMSMFDPTVATSHSLSSSSPAPQVSAEELNKSKAVAAMRAKAAQQEADDAEKLEKTDDVNARLTAWKAGKEQNLRALLATLDSLIWPGAQWKGAQMSELIDPKKCKIAYMKAIAKVHPDKLPSDVTVEQKMIASGVFATLNQAWDAFKAQNHV